MPKEAVDDIIELFGFSDDKMIVLENDQVIIKMGWKDFKSLLTKCCGSFITRNVFKRIYACFCRKNIFRLSNSPSDVHCCEFIVAFLLESGKAKVFDKSQGKWVGKIRLVRYYYNHGSLQAGGGREFRLPDSDSYFFQVQDWIS